MAAHKKRNGAPMVSYVCKQGEHGAACVEFVAEMQDVIVCHCSCHPPCQRPACQTTIRKQRTSRTTCPSCFTLLPLTGVCDQCG